ncbi:hypothetical protein EDB83DRAFT_2317358 [Lactarius deliciosus]|nr:hypothetical protein EDB83DRAFT_2317358 [Lactarius deliciosus]
MRSELNYPSSRCWRLSRGRLTQTSSLLVVTTLAAAANLLHVMIASKDFPCAWGTLQRMQDQSTGILQIPAASARRIVPQVYYIHTRTLLVACAGFAAANLLHVMIASKDFFPMRLGHTAVNAGPVHQHPADTGGLCKAHRTTKLFSSLALVSTSSLCAWDTLQRMWDQPTSSRGRHRPVQGAYYCNILYTY